MPVGDRDGSAVGWGQADAGVEPPQRYGEKLAVDGPDFVVQPAIVTGFLGPNGAGKSTTMRMIAGLGEPVAPGAPTPWPDDLVKRRIGFSCLARPAPYTTCVESCRAGEERW